MSFRDAPPQKTALQSDGFRNIGVPALILGGIAFVLWTGSQFLWNTAEQSVHTTVAINKSLQTGNPLFKSGSVSANIQGIVDEQEAAQAGRPGREPAAAASPATEQGEGPGTVSIMPGKASKQKIVSEWRMRGVIYDLITLEPIPGVHMIFTDNETNSKAQIVTDSAGRYRALLPVLGDHGYLVTLSKSGYSKSYLNPGTEGVAEMPLARREELAKELSSVIGEAFSLEPNSDTPLVTDFHMAPK